MPVTMTTESMITQRLVKDQAVEAFDGRSPVLDGLSGTLFFLPQLD